MTPDFTQAIIAEDIEGNRVAPSSTNPKRGYWFERSFIYSMVGVSAPSVLMPDAAAYMLTVLQHDAEHAALPWRAEAARFADQLAAAITEHDAYWNAVLEDAQ
jgi:hypothetical protein